MQEGDDEVRFWVGDLGAELGGAHQRNRRIEIPDRARVKVRRRKSDIAERSGAEGVLVGDGLGDLVTTLVVRR
jgi:hypothetical protein